MPNQFISPQQLLHDIMERADNDVAIMPLEDVRKFAAMQTCTLNGVVGAVVLALVIAAKKRLEELGRA